jgi:ubiquinone/menaquinone biosynthesis C-methylase UbiE
MRAANGSRAMAMEPPSAAWWTNDLTRFLKMVRLIGQRVRPAGHILEVGPGPGYLAIELASRGYRVSALDVSTWAVATTQRNAAVAGVDVDVRHGSALAMPFADASFDGVVCVDVLKNFSDPIGVLNEMHRVLRPGGEASIVDLRQDARREDIDAEVRNMFLSPWQSLVTRWTFRARVLKRAYSHAQLERMAGQSRFGGGELNPDGIGVELRLKKEAFSPR